MIRRDVTFNETDFGHQKQTVKMELEEEVEADTEPEDCNCQQLRRSQRATKGQPATRFGFDEYADHTDVAKVTHMALRAAIEEPSTIQEALDSKYSTQWRAAADTEYRALMENETGELVKLPHNRKAIGCKWVFSVKYNGCGEVERFKGRLVPKGYSQRYGIDYDETFSPVVRLSSLRTLVSLCCPERRC